MTRPTRFGSPTKTAPAVNAWGAKPSTVRQTGRRWRIQTFVRARTQRVKSQLRTSSVAATKSSFGAWGGRG